MGEKACCGRTSILKRRGDMSVFLIAGQVVLLAALTVMFLANCIMFFFLVKNVYWLWKRRTDDMKELGDYVAEKIKKEMMGE